MDSRQEALDQEAQAYEESMNRFIEGLRTSLEEALLDMSLFMQNVTSAVISNAPAIVEQYKGLEVALDGAIIDPWTEAANKIKSFGGVNGLGVMNSWVTEGGAIYDFDTKATEQLKSPWEAGKTAVGTFENSVNTAMGKVYTSVQSNVSSSLTELNKLKTEMGKINDTTVEPTVTTSGNNGGDKGKNPKPSSNDVKEIQETLNTVFKESLNIDGLWGPKTEAALKRAQKKMGVAQSGQWDSITRTAMIKYITKTIGDWGSSSSSSMIGQGIAVLKRLMNRLPMPFYAKGTLGTKRDEWAMTDEPWLGDELVLVPTAQGNLSYMRKGTSVIPADLTTNLMEWGQFSPDMMKVGSDVNLNMINNAVNKPEFNLSFEALVKADRIDEGTLPEIKKYVTQEINSLVKQMNYAIKGYSR